MSLAAARIYFFQIAEMRYIFLSDFNFHCLKVPVLENQERKYDFVSKLFTLRNSEWEL